MDKEENFMAFEDEELEVEELEELSNLKEQSEDEEIGYIKMDYSLETPEERVKKVEEIISKTPPERLTQRYLEKLSDYIVFALDKQEKKEKKIVTENHMITVKNRETSFEGLVSHFENNENTGDVIYNMITNDKNIIFKPKFVITEEDIAEVPGLKELREEIDKVENLCKNTRGKKAYNLKKQVISMRQDQYVMKKAYKPISITTSSAIKSFKKLNLNEKVFINKEGEVESTGFINFYDPEHVSALLCNYEKLEQENWANCMGDVKWMLMDFKNLINIAFANNPILLDITLYKMYSYTNAEIQKILKMKHDTTFSIEYLSYLWRNKIPKMIAETATEKWLIWHYTVEEKGYWKRCTKCGQIKLGINRFFSKNNSSKDHLYSICKECRNKKSKEK